MRLTQWRWLLGVGLACLCMLGASATTALASPTPPTQDPFYSYSGPLAGLAPGTILKTRQVAFETSGHSLPVKTTQILFRTTDELGNPTLAVTTVIEPLSGATQKIISYQWAYDGMASNCEPSYAIQGGTPTESTNSSEQQLVVPMVMAGDTVVVTDYESEGNDFAAGREEGQVTLDGIRAAESLLKWPAATPVALMGYSGGAIASDWASELAPSYAPHVNIVGTAEGGIAVDFAHNLDYINGSQEWSGAIPAALIGIARAFHIDLAQYLSPYGVKVTDAVGKTCLETDLGGYPGLTYQQLLKPQYTNVDQIPVLVHAIDNLIMGTGGVPREPFYMGIGNADGRGDDVMVLADDEALAHVYCNEGLPVQFNIYKGDNHGSAGEAFLPAAEEWVVARLNGVAPDNGCASIPAGDSLAPLAVAPLPATGRLHLRVGYRGSRGRTVRLALSTTAPARVTVRLLNASRRVLARRTLSLRPGRRIVTALRIRRQLPPGHYFVLVFRGHRRVARTFFRVRRR
ncbi:lipase family protein [Conexibacter sp. DBS9H8]|uniref:lipase family protein n=1 Tax=Conexibacter sp. DBS9H8 TaxID=2937801 RepID=UPI0020102783|nr:lipase family protein [Conexibacter sp. DBS9H8]